MWTHFHMPSCFRSLNLVMYPPVKFNEAKLQYSRDGVLSLGQFRPEKRHKLQLQILKHLEHISPPTNIIGGCRTQAEEKYIMDLEQMKADLSLQNVSFAVNLPLEKIEEKFSNTRVGLHTMIEEHFGISVLEMLVRKILIIGIRYTSSLSQIRRPVVRLLRDRCLFGRNRRRIC